MTEQQAAEKTIQERLNARCESLEQYLFDCFMDAKYANAASKAGSVVFLLKRDVETLLEETAKLSGVQFQKGQRWISVEDELPAAGERVLTWLQGAKLTSEERNEMFVGYKMNEKNDVWIVGNAFSFDLGKVTHWQKLPPSPPKNDKV